MVETATQQELDVPDFSDEEIDKQVDSAVERFKKKIDRIADE